MTKQTSLVFLLAACLALAAEGKMRRAVLLFGGVLGTLLALVAAVTWRVEPQFARSLVGEGAMPWGVSSWLELLSVIIRAAPDPLILPAAGVVLALRQQPRDTAAAPGLVLLVTTLVLSSKVGASQNYYLSLRMAEAVSVGLLWQNITRNSSPRRSRMPSVLLLATNLVLIPGTLLALLQLNYVTRDMHYFHSPEGLSKINKSQRMFQFASMKPLHLLSDWSMVDLYQGDRAVLGDAFLYKALVETGKLSAAPVEARVESGSYDAIMTLHDINSPAYLKKQIRLPRSVVDQVKKANYLADGSLGLYVYLQRVARAGRKNEFRTRVPPHLGLPIPGWR